MAKLTETELKETIKFIILSIPENNDVRLNQAIDAIIKLVEDNSNEPRPIQNT